MKIVSVNRGSEANGSRGKGGEEGQIGKRYSDEGYLKQKRENWRVSREVVKDETVGEGNSKWIDIGLEDVCEDWWWDLACRSTRENGIEVQSEYMITE